MLLPVRRPDLSFSRSNQPGFAGTSATTIPGPVAGRILNCDVKIAVLLSFLGNDAPCKSEPFILNPGAL